MALAWLPVNLDSARYYSEKVLSLVSKGSPEGALATNILGDISFSKSDYISAAGYYESVLQNSGNRVEWLAAYVGLMNIYQRTSDNMAFYQYRDKALLELRGINDELAALSARDRRRVASAETDVRIVSAIYFFELEQNDQGLSELSRINSGDRLRGDTLRFLRWNTLRGLGLVRGAAGPAAFSDRMRYLYNTYQIAERNNYVCQSGLALQGMASVILDAGPEALSEIDSRIINDINPSGVDRLSLVEQLLLRALRKFLHYDSMFGVVETYCLLGSCAIETGEYDAAVSWLSKALDMLNVTRDIAAPDAEGIPYLEPYRDDTVIVENLLIEYLPLVAVPECMSRIREQMSLAYSGLGNKLASDYNRNVYLELQKTIRLDRRYEARQQLLRRMNRSLNVALAVVVTGVFFLSVFLLMFGRAIQRRNRQYAGIIQKVMKLCESLLSVRTEGDSKAKERIEALLDRDLKGPLGLESISVSVADDGDVSLEYSAPKDDKDIKTVVDTVVPFVAAALHSDDIGREIDDDRKIAVKEHYIRSVHTDENRYQNLLRRACHSVVLDCMPLIDRMVAETSRLKAGDVAITNHLEYISELASRASQYNSVLTQWIKMCQGEVSLHIENFEIQPLLDLIRRSDRSFMQKQVKLTVCDSDEMVKADRALTLFMLNTLADNARKFTPPGGEVSVTVGSGDGWIELAVIDTGIGLSAEDVRLLRDTKVYNPDKIGRGNGITGSKGNGFGLMNCKGIIEKYRKTGGIFECCSFDVESSSGKGSRFSFRLPKGVRRMICLLLIVIPSFVCADDTLVNDSLLKVAYTYADSLYQSNVNGSFDRSLDYASAAVDALNRDYISMTGNDSCLIRLANDGVPAELLWLAEGFETDYETVLWIRNEVAVAALALQKQDLYRYNNDAYLMLFRRYYSDSVIERDCMQLQRSNSNIRIAIVLVLLLLIGFLLYRFVLHSKNWLRYRSDLQQILKITGLISESMTNTIRNGNYDLGKMADGLLKSVKDDINVVLPYESVCVAVVNDNETVFSVSPESSDKLLAEFAGRCAAEGSRIVLNDLRLVSFPLKAGYGSDGITVGAFAIRMRARIDETDMMMCEMIARYMATALHNCVLRLSAEYRNLELMREESQRLSYQENRLHVQNMVMDNCLSTLKHETLSFPVRIKRLSEGMAAGVPTDDSIKDIRELTAYYRDIYDVLSRNVGRQLEDTLLKLGKVNIPALLGKACAKFTAKVASSGRNMVLTTEVIDIECRGDEVMLGFLLDNLLEQAYGFDCDGDLVLRALPDGDFVRIGLYDSRDNLPCADLNMMFTPLWQENNQRYVVCREIMREIDEAMGHPGCRINAEANRGGGITIWFTLPVC